MQTKEVSARAWIEALCNLRTSRFLVPRNGTKSYESAHKEKGNADEGSICSCDRLDNHYTPRTGRFLVPRNGAQPKALC